VNQKLPCTLKFLLHVVSQFYRAIIILKHQLLVDASFAFGPDMPFCNNYKAIDHIRILGIGLELACNEGSCGESLLRVGKIIINVNSDNHKLCPSLSHYFIKGSVV